jgi:O-antigen ligase
VKLDGIFFLLLFKCIYDFINSFVLNHVVIEYHWTRWFQTNIAFIIYFIATNLYIDPIKCLRRFQLFTAIISIQVIHVAILNRDLAYFTFKNAMRIPFASSNVIASVLVAGIISLIILKEMRPINRIILFTIYFIGLMLTYSRGAIVVLDFILLWRILKIDNPIKRIRFIILWSIVNIAGVAVVLNNAALQIYFGGKLGTGSLNDLSTNRFGVWEYALDEFKKNPLLGRGVYYDQTQFVGSTGMHNIILELLSESGIVGLSVYMYTLFLLVKKSSIKAVIEQHRTEIFALFGVIVAFFVNSLEEVCYFNYIYDVLFWLFAGVIIQNSIILLNDKPTAHIYSSLNRG